MFLAKYTEPLQSKALIDIGKMSDSSKEQTSTMITSNGEPAQARPQEFRVLLNGQSVSVPAGASVAAVLMQAGVPFRRSVSGQPRSALCAMGICEECRATVNSVPHMRTCQLIAAAGMEIVTG